MTRARSGTKIKRKCKRTAKSIKKVSHLPVESLDLDTNVKLGRREITAKLTWACVMHFSKLKQGCYTELGLQSWGKRRADMICIGMKGALTLVEVKSGLADFKADTKYEDYLPYCHKMYFCVKDVSIFTVENISRFKELGIGILTLDKYGYIKVHLKCRKRVMKKKAKREMLYRMAWRSAQFSVRTGVRRYSTHL